MRVGTENRAPEPSNTLRSSTRSRIIWAQRSQKWEVWAGKRRRKLRSLSSSSSSYLCIICSPRSRSISEIKACTPKWSYARGLSLYCSTAPVASLQICGSLRCMTSWYSLSSLRMLMNSWTSRGILATLQGVLKRASHALIRARGI